MIHHILPSHPSKAPRKKLRGKRRYFNRVIAAARDFSPERDLRPNEWIGVWHTHADWEGYGNLNWRYRNSHLHALCIMFKRFAEFLHDFPKPYQLWLCLNKSDSRDDALLLNSESERDGFPMKFSEASWESVDLEQYFAGLLSPYPVRAGQQRWKGMEIFFVYSPGLGEPIE